jgi:hypothetical protein
VQQFAVGAELIRRDHLATEDLAFVPDDRQEFLVGEGAEEGRHVAVLASDVGAARTVRIAIGNTAESGGPNGDELEHFVNVRERQQHLAVVELSAGAAAAVGAMATSTLGVDLATQRQLAFGLNLGL